MRLIDADMADVVIIYDKSNELTQVSATREYIEKQRAFLDKFPTIEAVPAVRCRERKKWGDEDGKLQNSDGVLFARCKVHNYLLDGRHTGWCPTENNFCSYGEREEDAD